MIYRAQFAGVFKLLTFYVMDPEKKNYFCVWKSSRQPYHTKSPATDQNKTKEFQ
jgi:hypothetical protein